MNHEGYIAALFLQAIAWFQIGKLIERRKQQRAQAAIARINEKYRPERDR